MFLVILVAILALPGMLRAQTDDFPNPDNYKWVSVVDGLDNPLYVTHAGDGSRLLYAVEQLGFVLIVEDGQFDSDPFLNVSELLSNDVFQGRYTERGLLGLAFDPDFESNGHFYVNHTDRDGNTVVARYTVMADNPRKADAESREIILTLEQPYDNHNSGHMVFGPDGYLYMGLGDGGSAGDPDKNGQNPTNLFATIIRIDVSSGLPYTIPEDNPFVDVAGYRPEIWVYGLRNPWRFSFDRATGDLYIGDVGQGELEEISFQPADSAGGENYGWNTYEGTLTYEPETAIAGDPDAVVPPIIEYTHDLGCSVTGGYVYRGEALSELSGIYFYGDYCNGRLGWARRTDDGEWISEVFADTDHNIASFGEDEAGELYMVDYKGGIYKLVAVDTE